MEGYKNQGMRMEEGSEHEEAIWLPLDVFPLALIEPSEQLFLFVMRLRWVAEG